ncbi:hypothetical protein [Roseinatronobacter monicus]|uniref:hypothetical protein n=1 Tax=Roseinatronobacter monicus TaxID=393481 RepID=UPI003F666EFD
MQQDLTLFGLIKRVFPAGTRPNGHKGRPAHSLAPLFPPDLFAVVGMLLETAGAYHHVVPGLSGESDFWPPQSIGVSQIDLESWRTTATDWKADERATAPPDAVQQLWSALLTEKDSKVFTDKLTFAPKWWRSAYALLVIADEACIDVGYAVTFETVEKNLQNWIVSTVQTTSMKALVPQETLETESAINVHSANVSITLEVDRDVVCVQPKARTPRVGCTLRSLSHNLALLPPRGVVRAHWQRLPVTATASDENELNILVVPYPYEIDARWFTKEAADDAADRPDWGWFQLEQKWLNAKDPGRQRGQIKQFVRALVESAIKRIGPIHGVVFPEYALDGQMHAEIAEMFRTESAFRDCEFLISGSATNCLDVAPQTPQLARGNFAVVSQFITYQTANGTSRRTAFTTSRPKHHRWAIDRAQAENYGLAHSRAFRDGNILWERIPLPHREVHVHAFRSSSVFATMICEDLARSDPCHELLRALGPNLVFVLLMDGPQVQGRWPARYATALADDPGSSVLTLTSLGLISRANATAAFPVNRSVALWKDDSGRTREILLPEGKHGVVLSLRGKKAQERTLDGRSTTDTTSWQFSRQQAVSVGAGNEAIIAAVTEID